METVILFYGKDEAHFQIVDGKLIRIGYVYASKNYCDIDETCNRSTPDFLIQSYIRSGWKLNNSEAINGESGMAMHLLVRRNGLITLQAGGEVNNQITVIGHRARVDGIQALSQTVIPIIYE
jgi:hypothetical protein